MQYSARGQGQEGEQALPSARLATARVAGGQVSLFYLARASWLRVGSAGVVRSATRPEISNQGEESTVLTTSWPPRFRTGV